MFITDEAAGPGHTDAIRGMVCPRLRPQGAEPWLGDRYPRYIEIPVPQPGCLLAGSSESAARASVVAGLAPARSFLGAKNELYLLSFEYHPRFSWNKLSKTNGSMMIEYHIISGLARELEVTR